MKNKGLIKIILIVLFLFIFNIENLYSTNNVKINNSKIYNNIFYSSCDNNTYIFKKGKIYIYDDVSIKKISKIDELKNKKISYIISNKSILFVFTKDNELFAIDRINSNLKWRTCIDGTLFFTPILDEKNLFIDKNGNLLVSLNIETGNLEWKYKVNIKNFFIYTNGKILQTNKYLFYVYSNKKIIVLKKENGEQVNVYKINDINNLNKKEAYFISDINIYNNIIYLCYDNGNFLVLNSISGKVIWTKSKKNYKFFRLYKDNIIVLKQNGNITCLNKFNGNKKWTNNCIKNNLFVKNIIFNKNHIFIFSKNGLCYILEKNTGKLLKTFNTKIKNIRYVYKNFNKVFITADKKISTFIINK